MMKKNREPQHAMPLERKRSGDDGLPAAYTRALQVMIVVLLALALALRLRHLNDSSFWHDELQSACWAARYSVGELWRLGPPPLHTIMLRLLSGCGAWPSQWLYRLASVACGVSAVWMMYLLGRRLQGRLLGVAGALLLSVSTYHIWHSQQARYYVVVMTLSVVCAERIAAWLESRGWWPLVAAAMAGAGAVLAHYYALIVAPGLGIFTVLAGSSRHAGRSWRITTLQLVLAALVFAGMLALAAPGLQNFARFYAANMRSTEGSARRIVAGTLPPIPGVASVRQRLSSWYCAPVCFGYTWQTRVVRGEGAWYFGMCVVGILGGVCVPRTRRAAVLAGCVVAGMVYVQQMVASSIFNNRYMSAGLPFYLLGCANGCVVLGDICGRLVALMASAEMRPRVRRATAVGTGLLAALALAVPAFFPPAWREAYSRAMTDHDWRAIGEFMHQQAGRRIVLHAPHRTLSKCPYMYLTGVAGHAVDYVAERDIIVRRGVHEVATTPFCLVLQDATPRSVRAIDGWYSTQLGPFYVVGARAVHSNYAEAFAQLAALDPSYQRERETLRAELRALPPRPRLDVGTQDARPYLARGWSHDERQGALTYAWSYDEEAAVIVPRVQGTTFELQARLVAYQPMPVDVYANTSYLTSWTARSTWETATFGGLPSVCTNDLNFVVFVPRRLRWRDYEEFEGDGRQLGIALDWLQVIDERGRMVPDGGVIDVGDVAYAAMLDGEWSHAEKWQPDGFGFRWIAGTNASLNVVIPPRGCVGRVRVRCLPFQPEGQPPVELVITVNNKMIGRVALPCGWSAQEFPAVLEPGHVRLMLHASRAGCPHQYGIGGDTRALSIAVQDITLLP